jgi:hypothetical protein
VRTLIAALGPEAVEELLGRLPLTVYRFLQIDQGRS